MAKGLLIVESPAKAKTIAKFLNNRYQVQASMGHVRDLPKSQLGVDVDNGFEPKYITIRGKGELLQQLRDRAAKADKVLLATDPDREGEAISWHLAQALKIPEDKACRVTFNEITKDAVRAAIKQPRPINKALVEAQQARRILDRLVGYQLSPLLWRKVRRGLSAGRVQSVAVRIVYDREKEIEAFNEQEYWTVTALLSKNDGQKSKTDKKQQRFEARYVLPADEKNIVKKDGRRLGFPDQATAEAVVADLQNHQVIVEKVVRKERKRNPAQPFTTSSLQQEASRKLGFSVRKTMRIAQQLYEGMSVPGAGIVGLITYMRTDSTRLSEQAINDANSYILERWGKQYAQARRARVQSGAQDAHEAIRPTFASYAPEDLKGALGRDQLRLYRLIWERFIASQMSPAVMDTVTVDIEAGPHKFRANGSTIKFPGFMVLYTEGRDDAEPDEDKERVLPELNEADLLDVHELKPEQHFTQPPPRYTEAMLVRALEEEGIGRPSTYAPIVETIQQRGYVALEDKRFHLTELGEIITDLLKEHFPDIVDLEFTARMETELDHVEEEERSWQGLLQDFYDDFSKTLERADKEIGEVDLPEEVSDEVCEHCGRNLVVKWGRFGKFLACPGFPECRNTKPLLEKVGVDCPTCGAALVERRSRKGRRFYGCERYPECDFVVWNRPLPEPCPECNSLMVAAGGRNSENKGVCTNPECSRYRKVGGFKRSKKQ